MGKPLTPKERELKQRALRWYFDEKCNTAEEMKVMVNMVMKEGYLSKGFKREMLTDYLYTEKESKGLIF